MKRFILLLSILCILAFPSITSATSPGLYGATSLVGSAAGSLDSIPEADIEDEQFCMTWVQGNLVYFHVFNASSTTAESSPAVIAPDDSDGTGRWLSIDSYPEDTDTQLSDEQVQDKAGAMWSGNTETRVEVIYQDSDGTIDIVVDDMNDPAETANTLGITTHGADAKTTPIGADGLLLSDSAATWYGKFLSFTNLQTWVETFVTTYPGYVFGTGAGDMLEGDKYAEIEANTSDSHAPGSDDQDLSGYVLESLFDIGTFLFATSDNTPEPKTATEVRAILNVEDGADVTDTDNVTSAGALMDSEVDADIKTLNLPASTTISAYGKTLIDDADASTARGTLDVDQAGTDNSTNVTLNASATTGGMSLSGQEISNQAATSGQNGYATSTQVTAQEANTTHRGLSNNPHSVDYTQSGAIQDANDTVTDAHINFGFGTAQISAVKIPILDEEQHFSEDNVEKALEELADLVSGVSFDLFWNDSVSAIGGYLSMAAAETGEVESSTTASGLGTGDAQVVEEFAATTTDTPSVLVPGIFEVHFHAAKTSGSKDVILFAELYKRASGGTETLLSTSEDTGEVTSKAELDVHFSLFSEVDFLPTDILVKKILADVGSSGSAVDITLYMEGNLASRLTVKTTSTVFDDRYGNVAGEDDWAGTQDFSGATVLGVGASFSFATANTAKTFNAAELTGRIELHHTGTTTYTFGTAQTLYELEQAPAVFIFATTAGAYFDLQGSDKFILNGLPLDDGDKISALNPSIGDKFFVTAIEIGGDYQILFDPALGTYEDAGP